MTAERRALEDDERGGVEAVVVAARLIEKATNSTAGEVDPRLLRAIKNAARDSEREVRVAAQALMDQMKKQHSQVRYLAVLIVDELFMRSKLFRSLLVVNFDLFLSLSIGFRRNSPLPPPSSIASRLRSMTIELLEKWNAAFGVHYRQLRLGFDYLKNTLKYQFPNQLENAARVQQERRERELRSKQILLNKFENLKENYSSIKSEIQSTVEEMERCLDILNTKEDGSLYDMSANDYEVGEFESLTLRQIRLDSIKQGEKIQEDSENKAIFDALRESCKLLVSKHLVTIREWTSVLVRVDIIDNKFRDMALKEFIDIRNHIHSVKKKCAEVGCNIDDMHGKEDEDDLWEEGAIEFNLPGEASTSERPREGSVKAEISKKGKDKIESEGSKTSKKTASSSISERSKLLAEAPVVTWGPFLESWGSNRDVLANQRGLELESHWGRVEDDAVVPAEKIAELNVHRTVYKAETIEIPPCRGPLKKGGLCARRDHRACPFHGPIILRDDEGNPLNQTSNVSGEVKEEASSLEGNHMTDQLHSDEVTLENLARQSVKNVRERDNRDMKSAKRAKLARVREHNEAVLRDAAIASTSYSEASVIHAAESNNNGTHARTNKQTLASMLRKKETAKDRLARRLLNSRTTDASTRELMQGDDERYREAFPNQW